MINFESNFVGLSEGELAISFCGSLEVISEIEYMLFGSKEPDTSKLFSLKAVSFKLGFLYLKNDLSGSLEKDFKLLLLKISNFIAEDKRTTFFPIVYLEALSKILSENKSENKSENEPK